MSRHVITCKKTGKTLAASLDGGQCVCPEGMCHEDAYLGPGQEKHEDFFTPGDKPPTDLRAPPTKGWRILAPFTAAQVVALDAYQRADRYHPFTCPNRGDGKHGTTETLHELALLPTTSVHGWICPYCDYTQNWAHAFMAQPVPPPPPNALREFDPPKTVRPHLRADGIPTRIDMQWWVQAELAIWRAMQEVERAGASVALTQAVTLLAEARNKVADHIEGVALPPQWTSGMVFDHRADAKPGPGPGSCTLWPGCGCGTQSGPHACEGKVP